MIGKFLELSKSLFVKKLFPARSEQDGTQEEEETKS